MVGLFGYVAAQNKKERNGKMESNLHPQAKLIQIIDVKKSQNLAILLRALNVTTEQVCEAVKKGDFVNRNVRCLLCLSNSNSHRM